MIRRALITTLFILYTICGFGQTAHVRAFTYDTNGNRIASEMLFAKTRTDGSVDKEEFLYSATDTLSNMTVRIYPNPTNDMFFVSTAVSEADVTMKATLVSATGAVLSVRHMDESEECFDLTGETTGMYFLEISTDKEKHTWKIIKR